MSLGNITGSGFDGHVSGIPTFLVEEIADGERGFAKGPERALMSALLFDGVMGYMAYAIGKGERYRESFNWVNSKDSEYIFSYENCCDGLGIHADGLRLGLINASNSRKEEWRRSRRKA